MSVSVSMPQLGESVTEGTVTRWLKKEGERVEADEPLLEVSTDKVDTEIPSPVAGTLRGITVAEDETVAVGAELAVIDETPAEGAAAEQVPESQPAAPGAAEGPQPGGYPYPAPEPAGRPAAAPFPGGGYEQPAAYEQPGGYGQPAGYESPGGYEPQAPQLPPTGPPPDLGGQPAPGGVPQEPPAAAAEPAAAPAPAGDVWQRAQPVSPPPPPAPSAPPAPPAPPAEAQAPQPSAPQPQAAPAASVSPARPSSPLGTAEGPYVTPLVRKLAAEHGVDLASVAGTGVGGRIRKQDVIDAARVRREAAAAARQPSAAADGQVAAAAPGQQAGRAQLAMSRPAIEPSTLRGTTERMSRARQLIARRMVESLQTSAQLTTVVEVDVTSIARLRGRAKADFEAREAVKLSFLPFFALAAVEALKVHPRLNASIEPDGNQVTYHDAEHLGIAVDTERGLMVPVIRNAGDLNVGGLARKIADLAARTRAGQVSPDDLAGGTFTLTNTGSRGALFDTPIINQPQVAILGTGAVVRRPVVVEDPSLGEVIAVRSVVYLALSYDHRLVDGADAARFLATVKSRLEEGAFEAELGL
ncbi:MAG TPA: 2-oxoglutarate dehydrogenase, E2 component, dihydrolipoamide succinyltransferase [Streptosporangiaceae bacterium]|nr:2-oxoglutarate dehydrogenase, E2 component, dihydrolipoamide succinyltransferase [Streptosporangiaceae bacterium]